MVKSATSNTHVYIILRQDCLCLKTETVTDAPNAPYRCNFVNVKCKCKIQKQLNRSKAESNMLLGYPAMHAWNWKETAKISERIFDVLTVVINHTVTHKCQPFPNSICITTTTMDNRLHLFKVVEVLLLLWCRLNWRKVGKCGPP